MSPLIRRPVTVSRVTAMVVLGSDGVCEISSQPRPSLKTAVGETNGSNGLPKPVTTVIGPPPIRLPGGHASGPSAKVSAIKASRCWS